MRNKIIGMLFFAISILGCKSVKISSSNINKGMTANNVIENHYDKAFNKETIIAKLKVKYIGKSNLPGVTASLRVKKDEAIWISIYKLGFPIGKALITPQRVSYYEKINRTYFDGDFALLSNWLGTELDFDKVQNLLIGQAILNLKNEKFNIELHQNKYLLKPKKEADLYNISFLINPENFKISSQEINQKEENKKLVIDYKDYAKIQGEIFPGEIHIAASNAKNTSIIDVNFRSVVFNNPVSFPFSIPNNYERIELK